MIQRILWIIALCFLVVAWIGCAPANRDLVKEATGAKSDVRVYEVFGMDCPGCHGAVEKLVEKIPGVEQAEANWEQQRLTVTVQPGNELNDEDIYDAVLRANFTPGKRIE